MSSISAWKYPCPESRSGMIFSCGEMILSSTVEANGAQTRKKQRRGCEKCAPRVTCKGFTLLGVCWLRQPRQLMTGHNPAGFSFSPRQHHDSTVGDKITRAILLQIVTDLSARRNEVAFINDGPADPAAPANFHPIHDHRVFNLAVTVNSNIPANDAVSHYAAANNRSLGDDRVHRRAFAIG